MCKQPPPTPTLTDSPLLQCIPDSLRCACVHQRCADGSLREAIRADDAVALSNSLRQPACLGLGVADVNRTLDGGLDGALHLAAENASVELVQTCLLYTSPSPRDA